MPSPDELLRTTPETVEPAREETYTAWAHPDGREQTDKPQPMVAVAQADGTFAASSLNEREDLKRWRQVTRTRTVPAVRKPSMALPPLPAVIALPAVRIGDPAIWPKAST